MADNVNKGNPTDKTSVQGSHNTGEKTTEKPGMKQTTGGSPGTQGGGQNVGGGQPGGKTGGGAGGNVGSTTGKTGGQTGGSVAGGDIGRELENVSFPVSKNDLVSRIGDREVNVGGQSLPIREVLNRVNRDRFESKDELLREIKGSSTGGQSGQGSTGMR